MTTVTVQHQSTEPAKRILRTIVAWVIAVAFALPFILGAVHLPKGTELSYIVGQIIAVATGITGLMSIPQVNAALSKIGLGATTVTKIKTATLNAADPITPAIEAAITAAKSSQSAVTDGNLQKAIQDAVAGAAAAETAVQAEVPLAETAAAAIN